MSSELNSDDNTTSDGPPKIVGEENSSEKDVDDHSAHLKSEYSTNSKQVIENEIEKEADETSQKNEKNKTEAMNSNKFSFNEKSPEAMNTSATPKSSEVLQMTIQDADSTQNERDDAIIDENADEKPTGAFEMDITEDREQEAIWQDVNQATLNKENADNIRETEAITMTEGASNSLTTEYSKDYADHITYTTDGEAIYTDPRTRQKYKWNVKDNNWVYWKLDSGKSSDSASNNMENPFENEYYKWCPERNQWLLKTQKTDTRMAAQTTETDHYRWDPAKYAWVAKVPATPQITAPSQPGHPDAVTYGVDEDGHRIYTDKDGIVFFWDINKNAWFPKIDDDFMARYQMNYGFIDNTSASEEERKKKEELEQKRKAAELLKMTAEAREAAEAMAAGDCAASIKRKAAPEPPSWFDLNPEQNTKVYVSNLPLDITLDEFAEVMSKCGMIMRDPQTQKIKLKLYTEADGQIKGDGLCDYIKVESVDLALKILDESDVRGHKIRVQRAKFEMRGEYNPDLKPKRKKKDKEKFQKMKEKLFDWRPEKMRGERSKNEKVVIIKNLFTPELFEKNVQLMLDYQNDLREECSKCGTVRKVVIYDLHSEGVAQVNMSCPEEADVVIKMMHGRYFGKRQLTAEHWDGKTKYKIAETETATTSRLNNWDEFLESDAEKKLETGTTATATATSEAAVARDPAEQQ